MKQYLKAELTDFWTLELFLCIMMVSVSEIFCISDQSDHWENYCAVMPISKKKYVGAEFVMVLLVTFVCTVILSLFPAIDMLLDGKFSAEVFIFGFVTVFCVTAVIFVFNSAMLLRFGVKGFIVPFFILFVLPVMALSIFPNNAEIVLFRLVVTIYEGNKFLNAFCESAITAVLIVILYIISVILYRKKQIR